MKGARSRVALRAALILAIVGLAGAVISRLRLGDDLGGLDAAFLSGVSDGNYHAIALGLASVAERSRGRLREVPSLGSADNIARLRAARGACEVSFGLAQDGSDFGTGAELTLIGRLSKSESVFFLGKDADRLTALAQLSRLRIAIGPERSGSAELARRLFALPELGPLAVRLEHHTIGDAQALVEAGQLDLMLVVTDEDTPWLRQVMAEGRLQMAGFGQLDVIARRLPHLRTGRIGAGQFDPLRVFPAVDKRVLRLDTLVIANDCASRSTTLDLLRVLAQSFPDFIRHNQETPNATGLSLAPAARDFFEHGGPELADRYAPWLVDVMPPANWAYLVMGVSLLFNGMGLGHRFRLWRIDVSRVKLEADIASVFGATATLSDIARANPEQALGGSAPLRIQHIVTELELLAARCRRYSLSALVPMGQEMMYRYQEGLINDMLANLRGFLLRST